MSILGIGGALKEIGENLWKAGKFVGGGAAEGSEFGPVGTAFGITMGIKHLVEEHEKTIRDKARKLLGCEHVEVCEIPVGATPTPGMVLTVTAHKAMAFKYEGAALYHAQADFDVKRLSTDVWRWNGRTVIHGNGNLHIQPCLICSRKGG